MRESGRAAVLLATALLIANGGPLAAQRIPGWGRVAPPGGHQQDIQLLRPTGGPVVPIFEGWYRNPDGTHQLCFGYFNTNTEEIKEIPLGPDNFIEPAEFNGLQPTYFLPVPPGGRRHYCVLSVTVPADWGDRDVVWTLRDQGQVFASPGRLRFSTYNLEEPVQESRANAAPLIKVDAAGPEAMGRTGPVVGPLRARAGQPLPVTLWARRNNPFDPADRTAIGFKWFKYQGPGEVTFTPVGKERMAADRRLIEPDSWLSSPTAWGRAATEVTFSEPGAYRLLVQAYNDSGRRPETSDFEFYCCWTNLYVQVTVDP